MNRALSFLSIGILLTANLLHAKDKYSSQSTIGVQARCTETFSLHIRGALHYGSQLEQVDEYYYKYKQKGLTETEGAAGFEAKIGTFGNLDVFGGGEIFMRGRTMDDTSITKKYLEVSPTGLVNFCLPFAGGFKAELINRLERRVFRGPGDPLAHLRYTAQTRLLSCDFTDNKISAYTYYEGYVQKDSKHMSGWGVGIIASPIKSLRTEAAFTTVWKPIVFNTVVHQLSLNFTYLFDFTNKE